MVNCNKNYIRGLGNRPKPVRQSTDYWKRCSSCSFWQEERRIILLKRKIKRKKQNLEKGKEAVFANMIFTIEYGFLVRKYRPPYWFVGYD